MRMNKKRLMKWVKNHVFLLIVVPCSLVIVAGGAVCMLLILNDGIEITDAPETEPAPDPQPLVKYFSSLTGLSVASAEDLTSMTTCVMIENSPEARPQSGLKNAGVVYEATAEGGITRFMAVYQKGDLPGLVGPVRSIRMQYAEWAKPYDCAIAHWGGADDALSLVRNGGGYRDADQFFNPSAYWRAAGRAAPHNGYTNAERQAALNAARGWASADFVGFPRAVGGVLSTRSEVAASTINIPMSSTLFNANYVYDAASGSYLRSHGDGKAHMDQDASGVLVQNAPKVVVALMTTEVARPYSPYKNVVTTGTGVAHVFQNGEYIAGSWAKSSRDTRLELLDGNGAPIVLRAGQVWISAVVGGRTASWQ